MVRRLFLRYNELSNSQSLIAYVSLDDGSELVGGNSGEDGQYWFDCSVHFHVRRIDSAQWADPSTIEQFIQPVLIVESDELGPFREV